MLTDWLASWKCLICYHKILWFVKWGDLTYGFSEVWLTAGACAKSEILLTRSTVKTVKQWQWAPCCHLHRFGIVLIFKLLGKLLLCQGSLTRHIILVNSFSKMCFAALWMCLGCAAWDNGIFLMRVQEEHSWRILGLCREELSSAD